MCDAEINEEKERVWRQYLREKPLIQFRRVFGRNPTKQEIDQLRNELEQTK